MCSRVVGGENSILLGQLELLVHVSCFAVLVFTGLWVTLAEQLTSDISIQSLQDHTMKTNLPKPLDLLIFCIYSLNFSSEFFNMTFL